MKNKNQLWLAILAMMWLVPATAHDPLRDDPEDDHRHDNRTFISSAEKTDLSRVRSLVLAFRETGDDTTLDEAWEILSPALEGRTDDPEVLVAAAFVAQSRHEFAYAMQLIARAQSLRPGNDEGSLLQASIHLVLGDAQQAAAACARLRQVPPLTVLTCKARVAGMSGEHSLALARLQGILSAIDTQQVPADMLAWSYSVAGDLAGASGQWQVARLHYQRSLSIAGRTQVRAALVDVLLQTGDLDGAWQALNAGNAALPLLVRRLIVAKRLNRLDEMQTELAKVELEFNNWIADEDWLHAREMARFFIDVVDRPELARRLALINIDLQREPEDLRLEKRTRPIDAS